MGEERGAFEGDAAEILTLNKVWHSANVLVLLVSLEMCKLGFIENLKSCHWLVV